MAKGQKRHTMWLTKRSVQDAIDWLKRYNKSLERKNRVFLQRVLEEGRKAASEAFGSAVVLTIAQVNETTYDLIANGKALMFLEFGAGTTVEPDGFEGQVPFRVAVGSYSDAHEGEFAKSGYEYWHFGGQKYTHITPRHGMLKAYTAIKESIVRIGKEVYGE